MTPRGSPRPSVAACAVGALLWALAAVAAAQSAAPNAQPWTGEPMERDLRAAWERSMAYYRAKCAEGRRDYCESAACQVLVYEDTDANLVGCVKVRGWRLGNGWYTAGGWQQTPSVPTSDWWFDIRCIRKVDGERPQGTVRRKYGTPESSVDLEAEAARICAGAPKAPAPKRRG